MMILSRADKIRVMDAIRSAEKGTSAEIRVHVRVFCWGDPMKEARRVFKRLRMHRTKHRNAVLLFAALGSRKFAVVGDEAIHASAGQVLWSETAAILKTHFSARRPGEALAAAVSKVGEALGRYFPASGDNPNELPNTLSG